MTTQDALYNFCLRLADNNMILAQRLAEWCSRGPILEEDLALTNISLDLLGQAENFYNYAASLKGGDSDADSLAYLRTEREYFNTVMVEQPNGDFAFTMVRQFFFSAFALHLYEALLGSKDENLRNLAAKALKEVKYHFRHSSDWIIRFGNGTDESLKRTQFAVDELWRYTGDMFEMNESDEALIVAGISVNSAALYSKWKISVSELFEASHLKFPEESNSIKGGYKGMHTEHLGHLLCEMQFLQRTHPGANW